jgi:hypothetical protein
MRRFTIRRTRPDRARARRLTPYSESLEARWLLTGYDVKLNSKFEIGTSIAGQSRDYNAMANFQAKDPNSQAVTNSAGFKAKIVWDDGKTTDGTIEDYPGLTGLFVINGSHAYPNPANPVYHPHVILTDPAGVDWIGRQSIATVNPRPQELNSNPPSGGDVFSVNTGDTLPGEVTTVTVRDPGADVTGLVGDVFDTNTGEQGPVTIIPEGPTTWLIKDPEVFKVPGDNPRRVEISDDQGDRISVNFIVKVKAPALPDIVATSLVWNTGDPGVTFTYDIRTTDLPRQTSVELEWVKVTNGVAQVLSRPLYWQPSGTAVRSYGPISVPGSKLGTPPPGTTHLRLLCDPGPTSAGQIQESNENNNAWLVPVKPSKPVKPPSGPLPDLVGNGISYFVPRTALLLVPVNGPLPVNLAFNVTARVDNKGAGDAGASVARFYLSTDATIDPGKDLLVAQVRVPALKAGLEFTMRDQEMRLPASLPRTFFGRVWLGMVVDATNAIRESNEGNNRNVGNNVDRVQVQLFDPIAEHRRISSFPTKEAAEMYLRDHGFEGELILVDSGWSRPVPSQQKVFSRFNGKLMPGDAFREQAAPFLSKTGRWVIDIQGADSSYNPTGVRPAFGEPNPRTSLKYGADWFQYVATYHLDF